LHRTLQACDGLQVACGDAASIKVQKYIQKESSLHDMSIKVVTTASESGSADAVRMVADKLTGDCVVVMSGDTITDISLASVLFKHNIRSAGITTVLSKNSTSASANTKLGKTPKVWTVADKCAVLLDQVHRRLSSLPRVDPRPFEAICTRTPLWLCLAKLDCSCRPSIHHECLALQSLHVMSVMSARHCAVVSVENAPTASLTAHHKITIPTNVPSTCCESVKKTDAWLMLVMLVVLG
jgi:hypothetical protein